MMNTKSFFMVAIGAFVLASCNLNQVDQTGLLTASVRDALNSPATLSIADEIESVEYIPLEMTNDDASSACIKPIIPLKSSGPWPWRSNVRKKCP